MRAREARSVAPGIQTALDVVIAPQAAFERLRDVPVWGWAFTIVAVLVAAGALVTGPAIAHAMQLWLPGQLAANPSIAALPAADQQGAIARAVAVNVLILKFAFLIAPAGMLLGAFMQTVVMLVVNAAAKGDGTFARLWALSINVALVGAGLTSLATALIVLVRGPGTFEAPAQIGFVVPSLAWLAPGAPPPLAAGLGAINVFSVWSGVLLARGMTLAARIPRGASAAGAAAIIAGAALFPLAGALAQR